MKTEEVLARANSAIAAFNANVKGTKITLSIEEILEKIGAPTAETWGYITWEDFEKQNLPRPIARQLTDILRSGKDADGRQLLMEGNGATVSQKKVDKMTYDELLGAYNPLEENAVSRKLKELSNGKPFIVLVNGVANVKESVKLLLELRKGYEPRSLIVIDNKPTKIFAVGDRPSDLVDENPLYPGRALRPDGTCDQINRSWEGVSLYTRQMLRVALVNSREINNGKMNVQLAHDLLDLAIDETANAQIARRFPNAIITYTELCEAGSLPTLKIALSKTKSSGGRVEEPFSA